MDVLKYVFGRVFGWSPREVEGMTERDARALLALLRADAERAEGEMKHGSP